MINLKFLIKTYSNNHSVKDFNVLEQYYRGKVENRDFTDNEIFDQINGDLNAKMNQNLFKLRNLQRNLKQNL